MKKIIACVVLFVLCSCSETIKQIDLQYLDGVWEIEKVVNADVVVKEYKINEAVEQFQYKESKGNRRKVMLAYNGNFLLNNISQEFVIEEKEESFFVINKTEFSSWKEEIKLLTNAKLMLENEQGIQYYYKKRNDIKIGKDGKAI